MHCGLILFLNWPLVKFSWFSLTIDARGGRACVTGLLNIEDFYPKKEKRKAIEDK